MMGSALAGTDECPGEVVLYQGRKLNLQRNGKYWCYDKGSTDRYFPRNTADKLVPEELKEWFHIEELLQILFHQMVGGLKFYGYLGSKEHANFPNTAEFVEITSCRT